jgi:hypothetical protein
MKEKTQVAASVRQRLRHLARERGENFQQVLVNYVLERVLYIAFDLFIAPYF